MEVNPKLCVVVGAGPGMGLAVARRFGREGFTLALMARRAETLSSAVAELSAEGIEAQAYPADAGDPEGLQGAFQGVVAAYGVPRVLVYNVSAHHPGMPSTLHADDVLADLRVNVVGALVAVQQVLPAMRAAGEGTILLTGGGLALRPAAGYSSLSIGKAGIRSLALSLAEELQEAGIHVATVTIAGFVKPGTFFDPDRIAERFWALHVQPREAWEREVIYREGS